MTKIYSEQDGMLPGTLKERLERIAGADAHDPVSFGVFRDAINAVNARCDVLMTGRSTPEGYDKAAALIAERDKLREELSNVYARLAEAEVLNKKQNAAIGQLREDARNATLTAEGYAKERDSYKAERRQWRSSLYLVKALASAALLATGTRKDVADILRQIQDTVV